MKLAAIGDEIGTSIIEQVESLKLANINKIEIRKIDDKYLWEFSEQKLIEFKKFLDKENIEVLTIDSPVGKKPIPYSRKVELFEIYLKICKIFNCKCMRIFSNLGDEITEDIIKTNLRKFCEKAYDENIHLIMENERATWAESPEDCLKLISEENNINILFDPANAFLEGIDVFEAYEKSKQRITYVHIRDFDESSNKYAHIGKGDLGIEKLLKLLKNDDFNGTLSIETHLPMNNTGETKRELFLKSMEFFYEIIKKLEIEIVK